MGSYGFNLSDFTPDLEEVNAQYPDRERQGELDKWPIDSMKLPGEYTVTLGRGSVRLQDRSADKPGQRTYDVSISAPAIVELNGVKYSSFVSWYTGSPIGLKEFAKLLQAFATDDPAVAAIRMRNAKLKGWFKNYRNNGYDNLSVSNFTLLEAPNGESTDVSEVKITDKRAGAAVASTPTPTPTPTLPGAAPTPSLPGAAAAPAPSVQTPAAASETPFWER